MRPVNVGNSWGNAQIQVRTGLTTDVVLAYDSSITAFYYIMTTDQARKMAAALIAFSDIQDAKVAKGG